MGHCEVKKFPELIIELAYNALRFLSLTMIDMVQNWVLPRHGSFKLLDWC